MDLIRKIISEIKIGHVTTRWDIVIYRAGKDAFVVGKTIKLAGDRLTAEAAAEAIYTACKPAA